MNIQLKKAIVDFMFENRLDFQIINNTHEHFREYIYTIKGEYLIGGREVSEFIHMADKLIKY